MPDDFTCLHGDQSLFRLKGGGGGGLKNNLRKKGIWKVFFLGGGPKSLGGASLLLCFLLLLKCIFRQNFMKLVVIIGLQQPLQLTA